MKLNPLPFALLALLAMPPAIHGAERPEKPSKSELASGSADLQRLMSQFNARRDALIADRDALVAQLKEATAEQRKAILEKMQAQQKLALEEQRALGRQIRDEMRKLRESGVASPR